MAKIVKELKQVYKETKKGSLLVYFILRFLVIVCMIRQIMLGNYDSALLCVLSLILLIMPVLIEKRFKIDIPDVLEIAIYIFIFAAEILGEIYNFYGYIDNWDLILHTVNGFLCAAVGMSLIDLLNSNSKKINLSPLYLALFSFCFSMTIGVFWEFFEYGADRLILVDMQKDTYVNKMSSVSFDESMNNEAVIIEDIKNTIIYDKAGNELMVINGGYLDIGLYDTMEDLLVNFIGAAIYSTLGYFYIKERNKKNIAGKFIITKRN